MKTEMKNGRRYGFSLMVLLMCVVMGGAGCGKKSVFPGAGTPLPPQPEKTVPPPEPAPAPAVKEENMAVLLARARQLASVGDYAGALNAYDAALGLSPETVRPSIEKMVEQVVLKSDADLIRQLLDLPDTQIPRALLLYALGYRYAARGDNARSREVLMDFLEQYPTHRRAPDARELLDILTVEKKEKVVKLGCLLPLSGKYAVFGKRALRGIQVALAELIPLYGDKITLIIRDTASDRGTALVRMKELIDAQVLAVAGPMVTADSVAGLAQAHGLPMVAMTQREDISRQGDYIFSNFITPAMQVRSLVSHAMRNLGVTTFSVLHPQDRYGVRLAALFSQVVEEMGGQLRQVVAYDGKQTDFSKQIRKVAEFDNPGLQARIKRERAQQAAAMGAGAPVVNPEIPIPGFEALFIPDSPSRLSLLIPQLIYHDVTGVPLLGTNIWHDPALIRHAGDYMKQVVITSGYFSGSRRPGAERFNKAFTAMYGTAPRFIEAIAHDTVAMLITAAMDEKTFGRAGLRDQLAGRRIFEGATGKTLFDSDGAVHKELFFLTVRKGAFVEIAP